MPIPDAIVPGYPYEGGLYWLLGEGSIRHSLTNEYYHVLYGPNPHQIATRAAALACLFDRIELARADHALPDWQTHQSAATYFHPELRLSSDGDFDFTPEGDDLAEFLQRKNIAEAIFARHSLFARNLAGRRQFICRLIIQIRLAIQKNAVIVGDDFFHDIYRAVSPFIKQFIDHSPGTLPDGITLKFTENLLTVTGLDFGPANYDAFCAVRASSEVSKYSSAFGEAIGNAHDSGDLNSTLLELMKKAMDSEKVAKLTAGALQTTGSAMNVVGMFPGIGTATSVIGIAADIGGRLAEAKANRDSWYLLGPKMKEIAIRDILKRRDK